MVTTKSEASRRVDLSDSVAEASSSSNTAPPCCRRPSIIIHGSLGLVLPDSCCASRRLGVLP